MEYLSSFRKFARDAFLALSLSACAAPQPLPEANLFGDYTTPTHGRDSYLFVFKDTDGNGKYDLLQIKLNHDGDPLVVLVGEDAVKPAYDRLSRNVVKNMDPVQPEPSRQTPSN